MPALPSSPRASVVRACLLALAAAAGDPAEVVEITIRSNGSTIVYAVTPVEARAVLGPAPVKGLSPVAEAIYRALTPEPQTAKTLARLAGYRVNPHFRGGLRELQRRTPPLCVKVPEGYRKC